MGLSTVEWIWGILLVTVWHELGHLVAARLVGLPVGRISLGMGPVLWRRPLTAQTEFALRCLPVGMSIGVAPRYDAGGARNRPIAHDFWTALGGPLASFVLSLLLVITAVVTAVVTAAVGVLYAPALPVAPATLFSLAVLSTLIALLNLLPIPGLDGGHLAILLADWMGWRLSPGGELRAHRLGMRAAIAFSAVGAVVVLWQQNVSAGG